MRYHTPTRTIRKVRLWSFSLIPDDPNDDRVIRKIMPVIGDDPAGLIEKFGLSYTVEEDN